MEFHPFTPFPFHSLPSRPLPPLFALYPSGEPGAALRGLAEKHILVHFAVKTNTKLYSPQQQKKTEMSLNGDGLGCNFCAENVFSRSISAGTELNVRGTRDLCRKESCRKTRRQSQIYDAQTTPSRNSGG